MSNPEAPQAGLWNGVFEQSSLLPRVNRAVLSTVLQITENDARVLEVGPGEGACAVKLAGHGRIVYVADIAVGALDRTVRLSQENEVIVYPSISNGQKLPFKKGVFWAVYSQGLVEHFPDPDQLVAEMVRVTKSGGYVLVDVPQLYSLLHFYKTVQIEMGTWQFGWERSYSSLQLAELMRSHGLTGKYNARKKFSRHTCIK